MIFASSRYTLYLIGFLALTATATWSIPGYRINVPLLQQAPAIDGDLSEWKDLSFSDGVWDLDRLRHTPWFQPWRNRLTDHGDEPRPEADLRARYYIAWDAEYLYLGAEVHDNRNDVEDDQHEDKRWYFKDCICWFIEAPRDEEDERFGQGDNAFCFLADRTRPDYGAWWRHGAPGQTYIEEKLPADSFEYSLRFDPWGESPADYILEARVKMAPTLGVSDPRWTPPKVGDAYGLEIVHTDPDGGPYGGHFIVYGTGDDDITWGRMILSGPLAPHERLEK
jgi:hypothetical protein